MKNENSFVQLEQRVTSQFRIFEKSEAMAKFEIKGSITTFIKLCQLENNREPEDLTLIFAS